MTEVASNDADFIDLANATTSTAALNTQLSNQEEDRKEMTKRSSTLVLESPASIRRSKDPKLGTYIPPSNEPLQLQWDGESLYLSTAKMIKEGIDTEDALSHAELCEHAQRVYSSGFYEPRTLESDTELYEACDCYHSRLPNNQERMITRHGVDIASHIDMLKRDFPRLDQHYAIIDCLGEGTFSAVYKALDRYNHLYDNSIWAPDTTSSFSFNETGKMHYISPKRKEDRGPKFFVAVKKINTTSGPDRILNELEIMNELQDSQYCAKLITAFRQEDQIFAIMPLEKHQDFRYFYRRGSLKLMQAYFINLFQALSDTHEKGIIHRDVKPANFLFNPHVGKGVLCDFGLAERFDYINWHSKCIHSLPAFHLKDYHGKRLKVPMNVSDQVAGWQTEYEEKVEMDPNTPKPWQPYREERRDLQDRSKRDQEFYQYWEPAQASKANYNRPIGYYRFDMESRPSARANRAGTRGFRAPETMFKCPDQTVSVDVWSVGVILLSMLTERFPFFNSNDDAESLMEIAAIFGRKRMERCAALHNRTFVTNVPVVEHPEFSNLLKLVFSYNKKIFHRYAKHPSSNYPRYADRDVNHEYFQSLRWLNEQNPLYQVIDLLTKCLQLDCTKRIQSNEAVNHPFFKDWRQPGEDFDYRDCNDVGGHYYRPLMPESQ